MDKRWVLKVNGSFARGGCQLRFLRGDYDHMETKVRRGDYIRICVGNARVDDSNEKHSCRSKTEEEVNRERH